MVQAFQDALQRGDRAKVLDLLAPDARISEGGATQSNKEYAAHHLGEDTAFLKHAKSVLLSRASMEMCDTARVVSDSEIEVTSKGKPLKLRSHERMALKRISGQWKIASIHWSSQRVSK